MECIQEVRTWGGVQRVFRHASKTTRCDMEFAVFTPTVAAVGPLPALFYLSGLTCTWANGADKAGAQRFAAEHGLMLVMPDTSPRGLQLEGEDEDWDFGTGAGFYVNASEAPWKENYHMFDYVTEELPSLVSGELGADEARIGVTGHSMGGHGALICALKRPDVFRVVRLSHRSRRPRSALGVRKRLQVIWETTRPSGPSGMRASWSGQVTLKGLS